ncbi:hypothetical protein M569_17275 [Genlisea aurea]|uniref:Uncharacterized protein n=1 Tax=Genlisea aurea TaxID=192259 RepID=S8DDU2_9LAMI|nr:hypothetical protein M569_17275 [Genlisea aurea]
MYGGQGSPSRGRTNQMPRGIKIKHVVEAILLLSVCTMFLYQVQDSDSHGRSHFSSGKPRATEKLQSDNGDNVELGRKGLRPRADPLDQDVKQIEETDIMPEKVDRFGIEENLGTEQGKDDNENKEIKEFDDDADDLRDVAEVQQLFNDEFQDDEKNNYKEEQENDDGEGNTFEIAEYSMESASPAPSPMLIAASRGVVVNTFFEYSDTNLAPSSSIYGDIEAAMKSFFGGSSDGIAPTAAAPGLKISKISAPSESHSQDTNSFIDSSGNNAATNSFSKNKAYRGDISESAESPTEAKKIHAFVRPGLESD